VGGMWTEALRRPKWPGHKLPDPSQEMRRGRGLEAPRSENICLPWASNSSSLSLSLLISKNGIPLCGVLVWFPAGVQ
jgi:hypothetical protein